MSWLLPSSLLVVTVLAVVLAVRYRKLRADVRRVLRRLGIAAANPVASRALYRGVREVERRAERAEGEAARLRAAVDAAELAILVVDPRGRVTLTNAAATRLFGGETGAMVRSRALQLGAGVAESGQEAEMEFDLAGGERRVLRLHAAPLPGEMGTIVTVGDLTDRRRIDSVRRDFLANAGHELKTPLGALVVLAETIATAEDPAARTRLSRRLLEEARRMARVVEDILALAAVESLDRPLEPVLVADVLRTAREAVALRAGEAGIRLVEEAPPEGLTVRGDAEQLAWAVRNLLSNAIEYTVVDGRRGGTVWYRARAAGGRAVIEVEDRGIGIAPEHLERIFERFYRVDRARSRASGGTGLGLSIVRNVARAHGGRVTVRSEPGVGSTFAIEIPILEVEPW